MIMKYGFIVSLYPIIISAEVHCGLAQQDILASILREVFGDALVSAPIDGRQNINVLPSPEELKGRVLIKAKNLHILETEPLHAKDDAVDAELSETTSLSDQNTPLGVKGLKKVGGKVGHKVRSRRPSFEKHTHPPPPLPSKASTGGGRDEKKVKMSLDLLALLIYTVGVRSQGLNRKEAYAPEHMFSLSEGAANKLLKDNMIDLINHTQDRIIKVYPKVVRINSTNYLPHRYWSAGAQLLSLNWQTYGEILFP